MNARLEIRLLAHSIDAATLSAGKPRRKRKANTGAWIALCAVVALLVIAWL